ncbi:sigma-70 family RNA polymerase sigma factor [Streptomyces anthocyanicus]|uniref:Sigma-70 family RNA polymerase sigma factor n=1 Tax=Streptomyces violaceolatus TaxID=67378 RepID=A0ABN3T9Q6_9ACTN|nr:MULTISPECIES: sigma-70 family RNA polymerase sigma factor [Streptomyces]MDX3322936.1 sigma-70 family RNA polymerase sigma factor [Streptomyces sp. ME03-5684b]MDX3348585.1 sigma-70 family RNA polymerase sigma factor [Streptomyces sp. ME02-6979A]
MNVTVIGSASGVSAEEHALRDVYVVHGPALYAYVLRLLGGDTHHAEDIVQETLLRCWSNKCLADNEKMAVRPWMFRVARNLVIDMHRTRAARPTEVSGNTWLPELGSDGDEYERILTSMVIHDALEELTPAHREILHATFFADRSVRRAAAILGIPQGTVKSRVYYALRSLKAVLQKRGVHL